MARLGNDIPRAAVTPPKNTSNVGYPVVINSTGMLPTPTIGFPMRGVLPMVRLSNRGVDRRSSHILNLLPSDLFYRIGNPIGNTNRANYRYMRGEIHFPIPHCTPIAPVCSTCMGVTISPSVYPQLTPTTLDIILPDIPTRRDNPWIGHPPDGGPHRAAVPNLILP